MSDVVLHGVWLSDVTSPGDAGEKGGREAQRFRTDAVCRSPTVPPIVPSSSPGNTIATGIMNTSPNPPLPDGGQRFGMAPDREQERRACDADDCRQERGCHAGDRAGHERARAPCSPGACKEQDPDADGGRRGRSRGEIHRRITSPVRAMHAAANSAAHTQASRQTYPKTCLTYQRFARARPCEGSMLSRYCSRRSPETLSRSPRFSTTRSNASAQGEAPRSYGSFQRPLQTVPECRRWRARRSARVPRPAGAGRIAAPGQRGPACRHRDQRR